MSNSPHRIRRLRYVVSTNSQEEAFAIRKSLRDRWSEELLSAIEGVFDEAVGSDRLLHLSKLEINLKVSSEGELMEVLPELIRQQLEEQLRWMKGETVPTTQAGAIEGEAIVPSNPFDSLLYYLQAGSLPWEVAYRRPSDIAVYLKETCRQQWPELRDRLRRQRETAPFYFRLLQFLPPEEVPDLVNAASEQIPQVWRTALVQLLTLVLAAKPEVFPQHPRWRLAAAIWSKSWPTRERSIVADLTALADSVLSSEEKEQFGELIASLPPLAAAILQPTTRRDSVPDRPLSASQAERDPGSALSEKERTSRRESDRDFPDLPSSPPMSKRQAGGESSSFLSEKEGRSRREGDRDAPDLPSPPPMSERQEEQAFGGERSPSERVLGSLPEDLPWISLPPTPTGDEFPLAVKYAGLVLLHPFIPRFLESTGVKAADRREISDCVLPRAAALLHFLATGGEDIYEYELGFVKVLLGLQPETPLLVSSGLVEASDREESEALLQAAIGYWSVLKNTSVSGLRSSFLQRSGWLREVEGGWQIQVESKPFDLLLDRLPWSISVIKLPWMTRPIYTEWQIP